MDTISSVALWRTMSTSCNWGDKGSSKVRGKNINPFWVGYKGNAPLCKNQNSWGSKCMNPNSKYKKLEFIMSITAGMNMQVLAKSNQTRSLGPKTTQSDKYRILIHHISYNHWIYYYFKKKEMSWNENRFEV